MTVDGAGAATLEGRDVNVHYQGVRAVDGVDLTLRQGRILGLIGPNGAGKTTFLHAVSGFAPLTAGSVLLDGKDVTGLVAGRPGAAPAWRARSRTRACSRA